MLKKNFIFIILLTVFFSTACHKSKDVAVNTLKIDFQEGDLPTLHPHDLMIYLRGISIAKTLFEGLTRIDAQGKVQLAGAKSHSVSEDGLRHTFILRENHWSDGTPVTAIQYEQAWKEALSPASSCMRADLLYIIKNGAEVKKGEKPLDAVGVKALDEKTLQVDLAYSSPFLLELLAQPLCVPLKEPKKKGMTEFNGPFLVASWERKNCMKLKPNPYFWNRKNVSLDQIEVFMVEDQMTGYAMFESGKIDYMGVPLSPLSTEQIIHLRKLNRLNSHAVDRVFWIYLNTKQPGLSSPYIRKALSLAVNRATITEHILIGGSPVQKPLPEELLSQGKFVKMEDLSEARQYFEKGLNELGYTRETFPPLTIVFAQQANRKQLAEYLQEAWSRAFDIKVQIQNQEWNTLRNNLSTGGFEICGSFEVAFYKDPMEVLGRFTTLNPGNFSQWIHPEYKEKIGQAISAKSNNERIALMKEAEEILTEEMPFIPICSDKILFSHNPKLKGYAFDYVGAIDFSYASFGNP